MKPAYHISLTAPEKRVIAEIAAIQSQIEWLMRITVQEALSVTPETAQRIVGSTKLDANADIWLRVVREKHTSDEAKEWAEFAYSQIKGLSQGRNDFLHTLYGIDGAPMGLGNVAFLLGHTKQAKGNLRNRKAIRVSNSKEVNIADASRVRDDAAHLSMVFAHIQWLLGVPGSARSPWRRKLSKERLLRFQTEERQRASRRERQREA